MRALSVTHAPRRPGDVDLVGDRAEATESSVIRLGRQQAPRKQHTKALQNGSASQQKSSSARAEATRTPTDSVTF
jgi:hypothetical protein